MDSKFIVGEEYIVINRQTGEVNFWVPDDKGYFSTWNNTPTAAVGR